MQRKRAGVSIRRGAQVERMRERSQRGLYGAGEMRVREGGARWGGAGEDFAAQARRSEHQKGGTSGEGEGDGPREDCMAPVR